MLGPPQKHRAEIAKHICSICYSLQNLENRDRFRLPHFSERWVSRLGSSGCFRSSCIFAKASGDGFLSELMFWWEYIKSFCWKLSQLSSTRRWWQTPYGFWKNSHIDDFLFSSKYFFSLLGQIYRSLSFPIFSSWFLQLWW